jgi:4'-phosphopantetheinyl transferase
MLAACPLAMPTTRSSPDHSSAFESTTVALPHAVAAGVTVLRIAFDFSVSLDHEAFRALADDERARAARFLRPDDGIRYAATRMALRQAIGATLGVEPGRLRFSYDDVGRPAVIDAPAGFDFNVSHSGDFALIAWARTRRVGVDIESKRDRRDWRALAKTVFGPHDHLTVDALPPHAQADAFFDVWTAKEALLKAIGVGIAGGLDRFSVLNEARRTPLLRHAECNAPSSSLPLDDYEAYWCAAPSGYSACIAWSRAEAI